MACAIYSPEPSLAVTTLSNVTSLRPADCVLKFVEEVISSTSGNIVKLIGLSPHRTSPELRVKARILVNRSYDLPPKSGSEGTSIHPEHVFAF